MDWKLYSFIVRSSQRVDILTILQKPMTPTQISKDLKLSTSHISRTLTQFSRKGLVKCLTPSERVGKIYELTKGGKEILEKIQQTRK
jgi:predicted transcriptional regulator